MSAMPVMIGVLCVLAIAYRYYSAFLAAKVAVLDDSQPTPAFKLNDGQNFHPTSKWVLFGHHFAAISGAGPLIGPVLAAQFGYLPGLLWIVIGVCLAGAVQDFLVLAMSTRRNGRSLAQMAVSDIGKVAGTTATIAILCIIIIATAGLGKVVVSALGGEQVKYPADAVLLAGQPTSQQHRSGWADTVVPSGTVKVTPPAPTLIKKEPGSFTYRVPEGTQMYWNKMHSWMTFTGDFELKCPTELKYEHDSWPGTAPIPAGSVRVVPGSSWGVFTIAATIPIALFVGLYIYKIRPGKVLEGSIIGGTLTIVATVIGGMIPGSPLEPFFNLSQWQVIVAMGIYGFVAAVLPVWVLLCPRDYLSSFLKIGTIALLVSGVIIANPKLQAPAINGVFIGGGPTVKNPIWPFLFITIMCGAISGFHALVSSGTTPKMIQRQSDARTIGYGAMLIEGLVGVVAMIAASSLPVKDYYAMNTKLVDAPAFNDRILKVAGTGGVEHIGDWEKLTQESLRGRTGGAPTLAVGMANIFDQAGSKFFGSIDWLWKYWYHFAIMFEALFILTTIDTGTRIGRFLLQEAAGTFHPKLAQTSWWPGAIVSTALIVCGWCYFINANSMDAIWAMFGVANQMLAVIALSVVSACIVNEGRAKYLWVTVLPLLVVCTTTSSAAILMLQAQIVTVQTHLQTHSYDATFVNSSITGSLLVGMLACTYTILICTAIRVWKSPAFRGEPSLAAATSSPAA